MEASPPEAMTGMLTDRASSADASRLSPARIPSRAMSVWMIAAAPASSNRRASSSALIVLASPHPWMAAMPSRASIPNAMRPGKLLQASRTSSGSRTATVPRITRATPLLSQLSMARHSAHAAAQLHRHAHGGEDVFDRPGVDRRAFESAIQINDMQVGEALFLERAAWAAGLSLKTVASLISPQLEADALTVLEVDGRKQNHQYSPFFPLGTLTER